MYVRHFESDIASILVNDMFAYLFVLLCSESFSMAVWDLQLE